MQLKNFVIFGALVELGCGLPKVTPCVYSPEESGAWCAPPDSEEVKLVPESELGNYVCHSPSDYQTILEWMHRHNRGIGKAGQKVKSPVKPQDRVTQKYLKDYNQRVHRALVARFKEVVNK